jgi:ABC-2 type transport system ATP-binding protein
VEQTVDSVVIIARGRLVHEGTLDELRGKGAVTAVVETPTPDRLLQALTPLVVTVAPAPDGALSITGASAAEVGHAAWQAGVELHGLREESSSLESVFLELTENAPVSAGTPTGWTG